jgi:hypothetical protein
VGGTDNAGETEANDIVDLHYSRTISMIKHSAYMVMISEASDINWVTQTATTDVITGLHHYAPRLGARHGNRTADGRNAFTNFAFMDGHVDLFPTYPIDSQPPLPGILAGLDGMSAMTQASGTEFTLFMDRQ